MHLTITQKSLFGWNLADMMNIQPRIIVEEGSKHLKQDTHDSHRVLLREDCLVELLA